MENIKETENKTKKKGWWKGFRYYATYAGVGILAMWLGSKYSEEVKTAVRKGGDGIKTAGGKLMSCCHRNQQQQPAMEQQNPGYQQQYQPRYNNRGEFNNNKH